MFLLAFLLGRIQYFTVEPETDELHYLGLIFAVIACFAWVIITVITLKIAFFTKPKVVGDDELSS